MSVRCVSSSSSSSSISSSEDDGCLRLGFRLADLALFVFSALLTGQIIKPTEVDWQVELKAATSRAEAQQLVEQRLERHVLRNVFVRKRKKHSDKTDCEGWGTKRKHRCRETRKETREKEKTASLHPTPLKRKCGLGGPSEPDPGYKSQ